MNEPSAADFLTHPARRQIHSFRRFPRAFANSLPLMLLLVNGVTGVYSRGASGFWIENGQIAYPVNEITIAGNLKDMFLHLTAANDLTFRYGTNAPTVRVEGMTIAGA